MARAETISGPVVATQGPRRPGWLSLANVAFTLVLLVVGFLVIFPIVSYILFSNGWQSLLFGPLTIPEWLAVVLTLFALLGIVQRFALARRMERS